MTDVSAGPSSPSDGVPADLEWVRAAAEGDTGPGPWIEVAAGAGELIHLRETSDPDTVVTTTQVKWEAFVKGVMAGEFDHFAELDGEGEGGETA